MISRPAPSSDTIPTDKVGVSEGPGRVPNEVRLLAAKVSDFAQHAKRASLAPTYPLSRRPHSDIAPLAPSCRTSSGKGRSHSDLICWNRVR